MFQHDMSEKQTSVVSITDSDSDSFGEFLHYLYTGRMENVTFNSTFHLFTTADKYNVQELKTFCLQYMTMHVSVQNVCDVAVLADDHNEIVLFYAAQTFFNRNVAKIFETEPWMSLFRNKADLAQKLLTGMVSKVKIAD